METSVARSGLSPFTHGKPISAPGRFVGRKEEVREIFSLLLAPDFGSCSIVGERQSGKTSLLNYISHPDTIRRHGLDPETLLFIYLDLGMFTSASTPDQFHEYMLTRIAARVEEPQLRKKIRELSQQERITSYDLDELFDDVDDVGFRMVLMLDEFHNIGNNGNFGLDFLYGLRSLATHHDLAFVTCSRNELAGMSRADAIRSSPWFNIFTTIVLRPFSSGDVEELLRSYLEGTGVSFPQAEVKHILGMAGVVPFLTQIGFDLLFQAHQADQDETGRLAYVEAGFHEAADAHIESCWNRSSERERTVLALLTLLARQQNGRPSYWKQEQLEPWYVNAAWALDDLADRGLIIRTHDRCTLASTAVYEWIAGEITSASDVPRKDGDELAYENRITVSLPQEGATRILEWLRGTDTKYRALFARWMCDPRTSTSVFALLTSSGLSFQPRAKGDFREGDTGEESPPPELESPPEDEGAQVAEGSAEGSLTGPPGLDGGLVSILFTDLQGSTEMLSRLGEEQNQELMRVHNSFIRDLVSSHRGTEIKTMGDGFMIAFPSPKDATDCAIAIQRRLHQHNTENPDRELKVRVGINAGEAISEGGDLFGNAVVLAARVMSQASGGQILISDPFRKLIDGHENFRRIDRGWKRLKGFDVRQHLHEVSWQTTG